MRSIRLSLIVYFLALLALALGAVSAVVYQRSYQSLQDKEKASGERIGDRYVKACDKEADKLDDELFQKARQLSSLIREPMRRNHSRDAFVLGVLGAVLSEQGQFQVTVWLAEASRLSRTVYLEKQTVRHLVYHVNRTFFTGELVFERSEADQRDLVAALWELSTAGCPTNPLVAPIWLNRPPPPPPWWRPRNLVSAKIHFTAEVLPGITNDKLTEYCQVSSAKGVVWQRSPSLDKHTLPLGQLRPLPAGKDRTTLTLASGKKARIVTFKADLPGWFSSNANRALPPAPRGRPPRPSVRPLRTRPVPPTSAPVFYIQYARDTTDLDKQLALLTTQYDKDMAALVDDTDDSLASLLRLLVWIGLATFAATVVGGFVLIRLGLAPLHRLSDAVSRVSEKDFRLQLDDARLPRELEPIAERLSETLAMLKRAFSREKQAAADISHELRTPLAALLTTTEVALRKSRSPEEYRELLSDCRESGKQMSQLVERLLALARLDAGADTLRPREVDVAALADQCAALVRPLAEARGLSLRVHRDGPAPLTADPDKLREVLTNLLHNAIEYNRPDGAIDLIVERNNGNLRLEVRDTGIGIPEAAREHIFERFFRADPSRQAEGLHAGLGLAIVKGYVDLMGGTIGVDSTEGKGSTFHIRLPAPPAAHVRLKNDRPGE